MPRAPLAIREFDELGLLIRSHHPLICVHGRELGRVEVLLEHLCGSLQLPLFGWTHGVGLSRRGESGSVYGTQGLVPALNHARASEVEAIYHFCLAGQSLNDPQAIALLEVLRDKFSRSRSAAVFSLVGELPEELSHAVASVRMQPPTAEEYYQYLRALVDDVRSRQPVCVDMSREEVVQLVGLFKGLTLLEVRRLVTASMVEHGSLGRHTWDAVAEAKGRSVASRSVLEYFPVESGFEQMAGMRALRQWLDQRAALFADPTRAADFGLSAPKGLLLLGVAGCGKSQSAKAVAASWRLPMLRLDAGKLYDKYVGATEANLQQALLVAEQLAPAVLWIDEIEKALASGGAGDGGTSQRVLGTFLTWLQERKGAVFVIATANDISQLPPELLRKGRFDEIFFVDLPGCEVRQSIVEMHLRKRSQPVEAIDLAELAKLSEGFSGSELEQAVVSALFAAFHRQVSVTTQLLAEQLQGTVPLSVLMRDKVEALRQWAQSRTVSAD